MIRFVCTCGHRFEVNGDLAGTSLQCPACRLLCDVPTLSEIESFTEEGTYRLDADRTVVHDADRMADLGIIYSKEKVDRDGNTIDLRTVPAGRPLPRGTADEPGEASVEFDLAPSAADVSHRPKYDPETGELVRPLDIVRDDDKDVDPSTIPVAKAALTYAAGDIDKRVNPLSAAMELFLPMNVVVMFFILCAHVFNGMMFIAAVGLLFLWPVLLLLQGLILSHYGNVIDEIGRNESNDLPRPLGDLSLHEDLWAPFVQMAGGIMIAFVVPITVLVTLARKAGLADEWMFLAGGIIGTIIGPAVLLTTNLSGSTFNLRPDRVLNVMRICGIHYVAVTLVWAVTWPIYFFGWLGFCFALLRLFLGPAYVGGGLFTEWALVLPALVVGIYLMHYFCWYLGLLYKAHHLEFPWVLQRFIRDPNDPRPRVNHAERIRRRRPSAGHLPPLPPPPPSAPAPRVD